MKEMLPYFVSIGSSILATITSIYISRRETKIEVEKLVKQHELDLETEREKHRNELEKQDIAYKHQLEIMRAEAENKLGADVINTLMTEAFKTPEFRNKISQSMRTKGKRK